MRIFNEIKTNFHCLKICKRMNQITLFSLRFIQMLLLLLFKGLKLLEMVIFQVMLSLKVIFIKLSKRKIISCISLIQLVKKLLLQEMKHSRNYSLDTSKKPSHFFNLTILIYSIGINKLYDIYFHSYTYPITLSTTKIFNKIMTNFYTTKMKLIHKK